MFKLFLESWLALEDVSEKLWGIVWTLIIFGALLALMGLYGLFFWPGQRWFAAGYLVLGGVLGLLATYMVEKGLTEILAKPVHVGVLTVWGRRMKVVLRENTALLAPYWPLNIDAIIEKAELINYKMVFEHVICRNPQGETQAEGDTPQVGAQVRVELAMSYGPDYKAPDCGTRLQNWQNRGGYDGVAQILEDAFNEGVRHLAGQFEWQEFVFMKAPLTVFILAKVADIDFRQLPRAEPNGPFADGIEPARITPGDYKTCGRIIENPLAYLREAVAHHEELDRRVIEIETFLRIARLNGVSDIIDVGAHLGRVNVTVIHPEHEELADDAENAAREQQQRRSDKWDTETGIELAQMYVDFVKKNGGQIDPKDALAIGRIDRKRAEEKIIRTPDVKDTLTAAATIVAGR